MIYDFRYFRTFELKIINHTFTENKSTLMEEVFSSKEQSICKFIHGFRSYIDLPVNKRAREFFSPKSNGTINLIQQ